VLLGAVLTGLGHGLAFLHAQDELNDLAPPGRRGEVSAAFVCCVYAVVGGAVVGVGLAGEWTGLTTAVDIAGGVLAVGALATAGWQGHVRGPRTS
jgi:hypothetical protein